MSQIAAEGMGGQDIADIDFLAARIVDTLLHSAAPCDPARVR
ncbi:hypothetical protein [Microbacterium murale]|uniref:Uncharacterized protein n=1 Tax=Microbacterium murale TaxID=1081040 RepID=A0ABU0PC63_9MICO|nr:hypothetical protein [Microbacterium murale]MDQ0644924.1 hypothetical protein [Microbacterium murale]